MSNLEKAALMLKASIAIAKAHGVTLEDFIAGTRSQWTGDSSYADAQIVSIVAEATNDVVAKS